MDRKAINLYTGIGGAYCDFCSLSKEQARDKERVDNGMPKDRDLADTKAIINMLITPTQNYHFFGNLMGALF